MNREEYIAKLELLYVGDRNALEELILAYDELKEENEKYNNLLRGVTVNQVLISLCLYKLGVKDDEIEKTILDLYEKIDLELGKG